MKRDLDLVRAILIAVEDHEEQRGIFFFPDRNEAGEIVPVYVQRLAWDGHEFLDAARNQDVWEKLKQATASKSLSLAAEVLQDPLNKYGSQKLGLDA